MESRTLLLFVTVSLAIGIVHTLPRGKNPLFASVTAIAPKLDETTPHITIENDGKKCILASMYIWLNVKYSVENTTKNALWKLENENWDGACSGINKTIGGVEYVGPVLVNIWNWDASDPSDGAENRIVLQITDDGPSTNLTLIEADISLNNNEIFPDADYPDSTSNLIFEIGYSADKDTTFSCHTIVKFLALYDKGDLLFTGFQMEIGDDLGETFSEGGSSCYQDTTTTVKPDDSIPEITIQENDKNCILATMLLVFEVQYIMADGTEATARPLELGEWEGACTGSKKTIGGVEYIGPVLVSRWYWSETRSELKDAPENRVVIQFTDDGVITTLRAVDAVIAQDDRLYFPSAKDPNSTIELHSEIGYSTDKNTPFTCDKIQSFPSKYGSGDAVVFYELKMEIGDDIGEKFPEGGSVCENPTTTPTKPTSTGSTSAPTSTPEPDENTPDLVIEEDGKKCFLATISFYLKVNYTMKNGTQTNSVVPVIGEWDGACTGTKKTIGGIEYTGPVLVSRWNWLIKRLTPNDEHENRVVVQFSDDDVTTALKSVTANIALNYDHLFPFAQDPDAIVELSSDIGFSTPKNSTFSCGDFRGFDSKNGNGEIVFYNLKMEIGDDLGDEFSKGGSICSGSSKVLLISFLSTLILAAFVKLF